MPVSSTPIAYRLEPRATAPEMQDVLQARIHDPLWLLGLQWRLAELAASDGGAPVQVDCRLDAAAVTRWSPGPPSAATARPYDATAVPLETLVEGEPLPAADARDLGRRAEAGLYFLRLLAAEGAGGSAALYRDHYGIAAAGAAEAAADDAESARFRSVVARRIPDATALY